jgi:hypothetical protein
VTYLPKPKDAEGRIKLTAHQWRKMKQAMWFGRPTTGLRCWICKRVIRYWEDFEPDHKNPRGMGGGSRDDRPENIAPAHAACNRAKGSKRI